MKITIPQHSIIMLIGPSNCGKSYFAENHLQVALREAGANVKMLSSDNFRRELLNDKEKHKHHPQMMTVSKQAFSLLNAEMANYSQYPVNTDTIIMDATNLSKMSRADTMRIARENGYTVIGLVFDYKDMDDYYKYAGEGVNRRVIADMVRTLRKTTLKEIDKKEFKSFYRFPSNDFSEVEIEYEKAGKHGYLNTFDDVCIVGDLHGCYDELIEVLKDGKGIILSDEEIPTVTLKPNEKYIHHILIGDIVDKGSPEGVEKLIEFIYKNISFFTIIKGNHEDHNYKVLTGMIKRTDAENKLIDSFFDSVKLFDAKPELKAKFIILYENYMYYYVYEDRFFANHAPCENRYLGKEDKISLKKQNTIMYPKTKDYETTELYMEAREEFFKFLLTDGEFNFPAHVFGHVMLLDVFQNKNKYGIDTGCVVGNKLSTLTFMKENRKPFVKKYRSTREKTQDLIPMFRTRMNKIDINSLDIDLMKRLKFCAKNKVNFVSGTMSPADKNFDMNDLESLSKGVEYFKDKGVNRVVLQPKYMGSRCNALIHVDDYTKSKLYSRNAFEIGNKRLGISEDEFNDFLKSIALKYQSIFQISNAEYILFDGELLPWNAMGRDLIETDFKLAYKAATSEIDILSVTGFEEYYDALKHKYAGLENHDELASHEKSIAKTIDRFVNENLTFAQTTEVLELYNRQLEIFGSDGVLEFKPFAILKTIMADGSETNFISGSVSNLGMFKSLSDSPWCLLNYEDDAYIVSIDRDEDIKHFATDKEAYDFFWNYITQQKEMEGIVIKPDAAYIPGVAPYMKVRNKEYLRLTYGFDYDVLKIKKDKLLKSKNIRRKLETSIKEYELGRKLLDIKHSDISLDNQDWVALVVQLLTEQENEKELDPRL